MQSVCNLMLVLFMTSFFFLHFHWCFILLVYDKVKPCNSSEHWNDISIYLLYIYILVGVHLHIQPIAEPHHHIKSHTSSHNQISCMIVNHNIYIPNGPLQWKPPSIIGKQCQRAAIKQTAALKPTDLICIFHFLHPQYFVTCREVCLLSHHL